MNTALASYDLFGNVLTFRAIPSQGAPYLLAECRSAPGAGAPLNQHPGDDESFYILSGRYLFEIGGTTQEAGPGDHVSIPNGAPHAFRNIGPDEAAMLILNWPGTQHEAFFSSLGRPIEPGSAPVAPSGPPPASVLSDLRNLASGCGVQLLI